MELKISCDASVKIKRINILKTVECSILDYNIVKDTLTGNIKIKGTYIKDVMDEIYQFEEIVPFTVVFRDEYFKVNDITCSNFSCQEIVNQGIDCKFDVTISYEKKDEVKPVEGSKQEEQKIDQAPITEDEKVSEKYDEMLQELLSERNDNFLEQKDEHLEIKDRDAHEDKYIEVAEEKTEPNEEEVEPIEVEKEEEVEPVEKDEMKEVIPSEPKVINVTIAKSDKKDKMEPLTKNMKENYQSYTVYYVNKESDVDRICKQENLNINKAYEDYAKNRRIIVK